MQKIASKCKLKRVDIDSALILERDESGTLMEVHGERRMRAYVRGLGGYYVGTGTSFRYQRSIGYKNDVWITRSTKINSISNIILIKTSDINTFMISKAYCQYNVLYRH
jgi:hypothetical protein